MNILPPHKVHSLLKLAQLQRVHLESSNSCDIKPPSTINYTLQKSTISHSIDKFSIELTYEWCFCPFYSVCVLSYQTQELLQCKHPLSATTTTRSFTQSIGNWRRRNNAKITHTLRRGKAIIRQYFSFKLIFHLEYWENYEHNRKTEDAAYHTQPVQLKQRRKLTIQMRGSQFGSIKYIDWKWTRNNHGGGI